MKKVLRTICLMLAVAAGGCATAIHGRYQTIPVTSNPPGAKVTVGLKQNLITPGEITLIRNVPIDLVAQLEGYQSARQELTPHLNNLIFGNAFIMTPGIITAAFDYAFGAAFELKPKKIHFELVPKEENLSSIILFPKP